MRLAISLILGLSFLFMFPGANISASSGKKSAFDKIFEERLSLISNYTESDGRITLTENTCQVDSSSYFSSIRDLVFNRQETCLADRIAETYRYFLNRDQFRKVWRSLPGLKKLRQNYQAIGWKEFGARMDLLEKEMIRDLPAYEFHDVTISFAESMDFAGRPSSEDPDLLLEINGTGLKKSEEQRQAWVDDRMKRARWQEKRIRQAQEQAAQTAKKLMDFRPVLHEVERPDETHSVSICKNLGCIGKAAMNHLADFSARIAKTLMPLNGYAGFRHNRSRTLKQQSMHWFSRWEAYLFQNKKDSDNKTTEEKESVLIPAAQGTGRVVTVYFSGTGHSSDGWVVSDRYPQGELIASLAHRTIGLPYLDVIQVNGVASGKSDYHDRLVRPTLAYDWYAQFTGQGVTENARHVLSCLKLRNQDQSVSHHIEEPAIFSAIREGTRLGYISGIRKINIIGWSRGAVTAIRLAAMLDSDPQMQHIPVHIFAVDPVVGLRKTPAAHKSVYQVHPNVKHFVAVYSEDERSTGFAALVPEIVDHQETKSLMLRFPGHHPTLTGDRFGKKNYKGSDKSDFRVPGEIVRELAETFLSQHGTILKDMSVFGDDGLLERYQTLMLKRTDYVPLREQIYQGTQFFSHGSVRQVFVGAKGEQSLLDSVLPPVEPPFINHHHRSLLYRLAMGGRTAIQEYLIAREEYRLSLFASPASPASPESPVSDQD